MTQDRFASLSLGGPAFWHGDAPAPAPRAPLGGDVTVDVCVIGAGFTGLWAAWYLAQHAPHLRVLVVEKERVGFGASGRNGGWLTGGFAWSHARYLRHGSPEALRAFVAALGGTVDAVIGVAEAEGIEADILRTDELLVATNPAQMARLAAEAEHRRHWGEAGVGLLSGEELAGRIRVPGALGALRVPGVARVQPLRLVTGLAAAVERRGVQIVEQTEVLGLRPGRVETARGTVSARVVLRCTEGFTAQFPGAGRALLPLNSAQIVTEPLPEETWREIGWQGHELLGDAAHLYSYCQRTREGRLAVGGRGLPYRFGSRLDDGGLPDATTLRLLDAIRARLFPATNGARLTHGWCGVLGVPRDWAARVCFNPATGLGWAGGYVGVGVSTANLAGRTLADLALGRDSPLTRLPWVNLPGRDWEPEPLRWLGLRGMYALLASADRAEARTGRPALRADWAYRLTGRG